MNLCLVIVFNHRFDQNLPILRRYYGGRFSHVLFLMPFADDLEKVERDVISTHHNSYLFQGFFGEARDRLSEIGADAYVIAGDDLLLNPDLHENNLHDRLGLGPGCAYTKNLMSLYDVPISWSRARTTYRAFFGDGLHWERLLPPALEAFERSDAYGIAHRPLGARNFPPISTRAGLSSLCTAAGWFIGRDHSRKLFSPTCRDVPYPAFYSYSDFLIIPGHEWDAFARFCEVTAAMQLFVEAAIPLAMVLACERVETEFEYGESHDAPEPRRRTRMRGVEFQWGGETRASFEHQYDLDFTKLVSSFPEDVLYYHPVKLSRWKNLEGIATV